ncbi:MAG: phosphatidylglycerophosphatase A, partial [Gammaproteobacteria bacterium]|nr:phosphatidylglycerophosphatase A [Gammaproteobacteria bacterium]
IYGIWVCQKVSNDLQTHDFSGIVWDEIVGYLITMAFMPMAWEFVILGFILFRFFDIVKPWPIKWLDKQVDGGLGIMIDDVLAGIFSWVILMIIWHQWIMVPYFPIW